MLLDYLFIIFDTCHSDKVRNIYGAPTAGISVLRAFRIDEPDIDLSKVWGQYPGTYLEN